MKILYLSITLSGLLLLSVLFANVFASCVYDNDWPEKPCLDTPPYSDSKVKKLWEPYYQMKGKEWMEMKKAEMETAIKDGTLKEWTEYGTRSNNYANYNVWFYYHLYGEAPDLAPYYAGNITTDNFKPIISYYYINGEGLILIGSIASSIGVGGFVITWKIISRKKIEK